MKKRLLALFLSMCLVVGLLPTAVLAADVEPEAGTLDLSQGSITITATGYKQGEAEDETAYAGSYVITQSESAVTANTITIENVAADQTVTLEGVNIKGDQAGIAISKNIKDNSPVSVKLLLKGDNRVEGQKNYPGIVVWGSATLTIDDCPEGGGTLFAQGHNNSSGIGATNNQPTNNGYGSIIINGGEITGKAGTGAGSAIGSGFNKMVEEIVINGGIIHVLQKYANGGIRAKNVEVNGGLIESVDENVLSTNGNNQGTITVTGGSINKGLEEYGSYKRVVCAFGKDRMPLTNTELNVTVGSDSWSAFTDGSGVLYGYFPASAETVSVQVPGETEMRTLALKDKSGNAINPVFSGISCVCETENGTLTMGTKSQTLTAVSGTASLALSASYAPAESCSLPKGYHFHGAYEDDIRYEIVSVMKNDQYMTAERYAAIEDGKLTVYGDANGDSYVVTVRAVCGPEEDPIYSEPIALTVDTYESPVKPDEGNILDISLGDIVVTKGTDGNAGKTVYTQGETVLAVEEGIQVTVTGTYKYSESTPKEHFVQVKSGNPTIVLKDLTIQQKASGTSRRPCVLIHSNAVLILEGTNTLSAGDQAPSVQINKDATLTIRGTGSLSASGKNNTSGIGAPKVNTFAINPDTNKPENNFRGGGSLIIESGTVKSTGTSGAGGGIGTSHVVKFGDITIKGGTVTTMGNNNNDGINATNVTIEGGRVFAKGKNNGITADSVMVTGGTLDSGSGLIKGTNVSITGGNINEYYTGSEKDDRILTKLYFVTEDGAPVADTQVTVTEDEKFWTAFTNDEGMITTYFASATEKITVSYGDKTNVEAALDKSHEILIGGVCSCQNFTGITWNHGLPGSVTLYGDSESTYSVANAVLVHESQCSMPIHPNVTDIGYALSVSADGTEIGNESIGTYAELKDGKLTLKPAATTYTVTLTAKAGTGDAEKSVSHVINVTKGSAEDEVTVIDLSKGDVTIVYTDGKYSYTQGEGQSADASENILLTGNAKSAEITVKGGSPSLTVSQDSADNVWTVNTSEEVTSLNLKAQTVNGKVRFGAEGSLLPEMGYISAHKVKVNPDSGDITFGNNSVTQGKVSVTGLTDQKPAVMGADTEAARTVANNGDGPLTLTVNNQEITLAAGGVHTVEKAVERQTNYTADKLPVLIGTCRTYLLPLKGTENYCAVAVGEGDAASNRFSEQYRSRITQAELDPDLTGTLYAEGFLYQSNLKELHVEHARDIKVYTSNLGEVYLGKNLSNFTWGNYCTTTGIHVDEENPYFATDDGALYTKDFSTLLLLPAARTKAFTTHPDCTSVKANATMSANVKSFTLGKNVSYIGGTYIFFQNNVGEFRVESGNQYFAAKDGILYSADMTRMVAYPRAKKDTTLTIPSTVTYVESLILAGLPIETIIVEEGANITGDQVGLGRISGLKEVILKGNYEGRYQNSYSLEKLTVPDGFNFSRNLSECSMGWIAKEVSKNNWVAQVAVSGGADTVYDGKGHTIEVTTQLSDAKVEYSKDGRTYSETAPVYTEPGTHTVYWRITKAADESYGFARELYSSRTFTISSIEASEDWFILNGTAAEGDPVTLSQPAAAPSLEGGYPVKYSKDGTGAETTEIPTEAGKYLVTVDITADGYVKETLTLGYYTVLGEDQNGSTVLSFATYGGNAIEPLVWSKDDNNAKTAPTPARNGYTFAGWYSDAALKNPVTISEDTIEKPSESTTYHAKWKRDTYHITYDLDGGSLDAGQENPATYDVEDSDFTLNAPAKKGYQFLGWTYDEQETPVLEVTIKKGSYGNKKFKANWEKVTYDIEYINYVTGEKITYTVDDTEGQGISLTDPEARQGYDFAGWQMTVDGVSYILTTTAAEIPQGTVGNIVLSGIWLAKGQTLTLNANGGSFADGSQTQTITADYESSITLTQPVRTGYSFAGWYTDQALTIPFEASTMPLSTTLYAKWTKNYNPTIPVNPTIQKPIIEENDNVDTVLSFDGTTLTITAKDGYKITDVTVNGISKGAVTVLTGLKTGDRVVIKTQKTEQPDKEAALIKGVKNTTIRAWSSAGKGWIKVNWKKSWGYKVDGYEIFRSTKKNAGYGTKAFFKTTKTRNPGWYKNTAKLKKGTKYYYKVRGYRTIAGQKVYTKWSTKAYRFAK